MSVFDEVDIEEPKKRTVFDDEPKKNVFDSTPMPKESKLKSILKTIGKASLYFNPVTGPSMIGNKIGSSIMEDTEEIPEFTTNEKGFKVPNPEGGVTSNLLDDPVVSAITSGAGAGVYNIGKVGLKQAAKIGFREGVSDLTMNASHLLTAAGKGLGKFANKAIMKEAIKESETEVGKKTIQESMDFISDLRRHVSTPKVDNTIKIDKSISDLLSPNIFSKEKPSSRVLKTPENLFKQEGTYARPSSINLDNLNIPDSQKDEIVKAAQVVDEHVPIKDEEILDAAKTANILTKVISREEMVDMGGKILATRKHIAGLKDGTGLTPEYLKTMKALSSTSTNIGVQLHAHQIMADPEMMTSKDFISNKLMDLGMNLDDMIKASEGLNWDNKKEVVKFYRSFVKPKWSEIIDELRYANMLSSPKTHLTNFFTNATQALVTRPLDRTFSAIGDAIASKVTGKDREYYLKQVPEYYKGVINSTKEGFRKALEVMKGGAPVYKVESGNIPTDSPITRPVQSISNLLEAGDIFFKTLITSGEKNALIKTGMNEAKALLKGTESANRLLFRSELDPNNLSGQGKLLSGIDKLTNGVLNLRRVKGVKWFIPFVRTPMAILKQGIEYSGVLTPATMIGNTDKIGQLGKMATGSIVMGMGAWAAMEDKTTWSMPRNQKEAEAFMAEGKKPYAVKIGNTWISMSKLGPLAYPFLIPAAVKYYFEENPESVTDNTIEKASKALSGVAEFFSDQSYVESFKGIIDIINGGASKAEKAFNAIAGLSAQMIPLSGLSRWVNNFIDPVYRNTSKDISMTTLRDQLFKNLPGTSRMIEPYENPGGEVSKRDLPLVNAFLPTEISRENKKYSNYYDDLIVGNKEKALKRVDTQIYKDILENVDNPDDIIMEMEDQPPETQQKLSKEISKLVRFKGIPDKFWYDNLKSLPNTIGAVVYQNRYKKSTTGIKAKMVSAAGQRGVFTAGFIKELSKLNLEEAKGNKKEY
jgi:hypothetical protein